MEYVRNESIYQFKKSRGINWTPHEKDYLVSLCAPRVSVIEDKKSDLTTLGKKAAAWKYIHNKFSARFGRKRTPLRIKEQWKRMKLAARAELRDRGLQPEVGVTPVDPNVPTTKYYGESLDMIARVQGILFSKEPQEYDEETSDDNEEVSAEGLDESITIKTEPVDEMSDSGMHVMHYQADNNQPDGLMGISSVTMPTSDQESLRHRYILENQELPTCNSGIPDNSRVIYSAQQPVTNHSPRLTSVGFRKIAPAPSRTDLPTIRMNTVANSVTPSTNAKTDVNERIDAQILEFARIEHARKMAIMEEEHELQMEVLRLQRDVATAKLKKANLKLGNYSHTFSGNGIR